MFMDPMLATIYDYGINQTCSSAPAVTPPAADETTVAPPRTPKVTDPMGQTAAEVAHPGWDAMEAEMAPPSATEAPAAKAAEAAAASSSGAPDAMEAEMAPPSATE